MFAYQIPVFFSQNMEETVSSIHREPPQFRLLFFQKEHGNRPGRSKNFVSFEEKL